jgi:hypothetical protein
LILYEHKVQLSKGRDILNSADVYIQKYKESTRKWPILPLFDEHMGKLFIAFLNSMASDERFYRYIIEKKLREIDRMTCYNALLF